MTPADAKTAIVKVLSEIQRRQRLECPALEDKTRPLRDLPQFDSPMSIGATGMIANELGVEIPAETNIFGDDNGVYTIEKSVSVLCRLAGEYNQEEVSVGA